jgi:hypothetical protein
VVDDARNISSSAHLYVCPTRGGGHRSISWSGTRAGWDGTCAGWDGTRAGWGGTRADWGGGGAG